jgi:transposase
MKIDAKTPPDTSLESEIEQLKKQLFLFALRVEQLDNTNQLLQATNQGLVTSNLQLETSNLQLETSNQKLTTSNQQLEIHTTYLQALVDKLQFEVARHKRWLFGSKTEQMNPQQLALFEETRLEDITAIEQLQQQIDSLQRTHCATPKPARKPNRQVLPAHLERVDVIHLPEVAGVEDVSASADWLKISEEIKEELDIVPAKFFVKRHLYPKYKKQSTGEIVCALRPASIIDGGYASNGVLAWVVSSKYLDHLPLNRIEQIALRDQVILPKSTLCEWVGHVGCALTPLALALKEQLVKHRVLHADETPVKQLSPKTPNKHHQSYLWVYRTADLTSDHSEIILFDYQASRAGCHPQQLLKDFSGHLMVDDYAGYKALFKRPMNPLIELGCWAHARRKFYELTTGEQTHPAAASIVLDIAKLYAIESRTKDMNSEQRQVIRKQEAIPILTALKITLDTRARELAPKSLMAKAVHYSLKRWEALIAYAQTGHLPIDNNPAENAVRPIALGRKNWLFVGSEAAGQRQAVILSLLATAKANGLDPAKWLLDTLQKLPTTKNKDLHTLLPLKNWNAV